MAQTLRLELAQEQARQLVQLDLAQKTGHRETSLQTERDQLRTDLEIARKQVVALTDVHKVQLKDYKIKRF